MRRLALVLAVSFVVPPLAAQHSYSIGAEYDPAVPTPRAALGYEVGDRFTPHHRILRYAERLAATSARVRLDTVGMTVEGREVLLVVVSSEANRRRLDQIQADAQRLAAGGGDADQVAARLPAIVWLGFTIHGGEASGTEASLALMYQLAAGRDAETRMILDSTIVLIDPVENPDGHERHVQDVTRMGSALGVPADPFALIHSGAWPGPRTSHYYFDLNRDWFILSHPETRGRVAAFLRWWPQVAVDLHEMGSNSTYFFAPPMEPVNKNVHSTILKWWDIFAAGNAAAFDRHGWSYFRREGYDEFYPGYGVSWPILTGATGMTYEEASSAGGAIRRTDGTVLTLKEAAHHHYTAAWSTLLISARRRAERVRDYLEFRRSASADATRLSPRAVALERDPGGRADSLVRVLQGNGIVVQRLTSGAVLPAATSYGESAPRSARLPAGTFVVDFAQPQGRLARALLEPDAQLDSAFIRQELESRRTGQGDRFYDVTAWSLPYAFRVRAWSLGAPIGPVETATLGAAPRAAPEPAGYAYAFAPGSETSLRLLSGLLAGKIRVWYAPKSFRIGSADFPRGAFLVRIQPNGAAVHEAVARLTAASGARVTSLATALVDEGTDLGSNSVFFVKPPRVGLLGGAPVQGNSFGFAWFVFDQRLGLPVTSLDANAVAGGALAELDVLVVP
ncbi:MAG TPA: M14 metallopeptidase family protein, partial [Gemmatimonadales bacterium]